MPQAVGFSKFEIHAAGPAIYRKRVAAQDPTDGRTQDLFVKNNTFT
jgi:hypothetical protein